MTTYVSVSHPKARFYVGTTRYAFEAGHFVVEERITDEKERELAIEALEKACSSTLGISRANDFTQPNKCIVCQAGFPTPGKLQSHLKHHKTKAEIEQETLREGDRLPPEARE